MTSTEQQSAARARPVPRSWRLHAVYPQVCEPIGIASIPLELLDAVERSAELRSRFEVCNWVAAARPPYRRSNQRGCSHALVAKIAYRLTGGADFLRRRTVKRLLAACRPGDLVMPYPGVLAPEVDELRGRGAVIVHDPVNTAHPHGWHSLQRAYAAAGIPLHRGPDEAAIADERRRFRPEDFAFACSPHVQASHLALGLDPSRVIATSLGWNPRTFQVQRTRAAEPRFLFVGHGSVRKGLPVLLAAWAQAAVRGKLVLVGGIDDEVRRHCASLLARDDVEVLAHTRDLAAVYGAADVFVLPSFEEGSPLVSYLALAAGLPSLLGPAAAGQVVRSGVEGVVVEPDDQPALVDGLRRLATDGSLRERMGALAAERAAEFTWDRVAERRFTALDRVLRASL